MTQELSMLDAGRRGGAATLTATQVAEPVAPPLTPPVVTPVDSPNPPPGRAGTLTRWLGVVAMLYLLICAIGV
ncbi:MAG: hypothetical protein L0H59_11490, partial [Tomitella sp.]|nr:hypothetical protein [Tomitella sp.]